MADSNVDHDQSKEPLFKPFRFYRKELDSIEVRGSVACDFAARAGNVAMGVRTILEILHDEDLRRDCRGDEHDPDGVQPYRPLFSPSDHESLQRLAIESMRSLIEDSEKMLTWAYEHHTPKGKKERRDYAAFTARQQD